MAVSSSCDVVVVGAGMAGLAAATDLVASGHDVVVLEASDVPGGRVASSRQDGFVLDTGFQVLNTSYPQVRRRLDLDALEARELTAGALVRHGDTLHRVTNPLRAPRFTPAALASGLLGPLEWARLGLFSAEAGALPPSRLRARPDVTARAAFTAAGLDAPTVERLMRPFLAGVLLESDLTTSRRYVDLVWRSFVRGASVLPAAGMGAIGAQLAGNLPAGVVSYSTAVRAVAPGRVEHASGATTARAVVVAVDPTTAAHWLPAVRPPVMRRVTTYYFATDDPPLDESVIVLDGEARGPILNTAVLTAAVPSYAPDGRSLISASTLGPPRPLEQVRRELARLYATSTAAWQDVAVIDVPEALPSFPVGTPLRRRVSLGDGVFVAGDHRDTPSIQGALASGTRAAAAVRAMRRA